MYKIMLVFDNYELLQEIQNPDIWSGEQCITESDIFRDGISAYNCLKQKHYDIVITEIRITGIDGLQLLRNIKKEKLCPHVVLCSEFQDFDHARQGIILGAFDYFVKPFSNEIISSMMKRIESEKNTEDKNKSYDLDLIFDFFDNHNKDIYNYVSDIAERIFNSSDDILSADKKARSICEAITDKLFERYKWLDLYVVRQDLYSLDGISESNHSSYKKSYKDIICSIFDEFCELSPNIHNDKIRDVIIYILNNPEGEIKQKDIASKFYMNSSYLSTFFVAHTEIRFVDYLTTVRLKRAKWLLSETDMKISDIAERLDYKDMGYFSRIFKKHFGVNPSEYRLSEDYNYQI